MGGSYFGGWFGGVVASPTAVTRGTAAARLPSDNVWCTDEDVACAIPADYANACPRWQVKAAGADGAFLAAAPWVLTSATVDFEAAGVAANDVVALTKPAASFLTAGGDLFAVDSVSGFTVTLRRPGFYLGEGAPPAPAAGLTGVAFAVKTYRRQIDDQCYRIAKKYGIDDAKPEKAAARLYDPRSLRDLAAYSVALWALTNAEKTAAGDVAERLKLVRSVVEDLERRAVEWGRLGQVAPPTSMFTGQMRR